MPITEHKKIALLIDAENTSSRYIALILNELNAYGSTATKTLSTAGETICSSTR